MAGARAEIWPSDDFLSVPGEYNSDAALLHKTRNHGRRSDGKEQKGLFRRSGAAHVGRTYCPLLELYVDLLGVMSRDSSFATPSTHILRNAHRVRSANVSRFQTAVTLLARS